MICRKLRIVLRSRIDKEITIVSETDIFHFVMERQTEKKKKKKNVSKVTSYKKACVTVTFLLFLLVYSSNVVRDPGVVEEW